MEEIPMKPASLLAAALVMLASLPLMSQTAGAPAEQGTIVNGAGNAAGGPMNQSGNEDAKLDPSQGGQRQSKARRARPFPRRDGCGR